MSRTHKKCMIASGALHLLPLIILVVAPAFLIKKEEPVDQTVLTLVSAEISDQPPAQAVAPPPVVRPEPKVRRPVTPPVVKDTPKPEPKPINKPKPKPKPEPVKVPKPTPEPKPDPVPEKIKKPEPRPAVPVQINTRVHKDTSAKIRKDAEKRKKAEAAQQKNLADQLAKARPSLTGKFKPGLKFATTTVGTSGVRYTSYDALVRSVYLRYWRPPSDLPASASTVTVEVVIRKNGSVKSARITGRSGNSKLNSNITDLIKNRVKSVGKAFPAGAKESERTYIIDFNLDLKLNG